jgi:hypothetical protein
MGWRDNLDITRSDAQQMMINIILQCSDSQLEKLWEDMIDFDHNHPMHGAYIKIVYEYEEEKRDEDGYLLSRRNYRNRYG